ncbi:LysR family transcriptional regulator [Candidimonas nitroreducens]|uniref:LysR family transcriptional regulator n=1 Tax=Candidimonas nitroreducens TaxID=683354 RepID=A0A225MQX1_9BURK|nr:LysR family transcriptional regulator [Candidimonas nitroreducens]OWT63618.1 LysR family transcriptional regulator [Candidimonas nitroreducens]
MPASANHLLARLRFRHLQLVTEVGRTGSLSRAAIALSLTQPALSKALKEIEDMLGFSIFHRGPRGLQQTEQGAVVVRGAQLMLRELHHMREEADAAASGARAAAVLRLGSSAFIALGILQPIISRLTCMEPPVVVQVTENNVPRLFETLIAGDLDALICLYNSDVMASQAGRDMRFEKLGEEPYVVIAPAGHRLSKARAVTWRRLAEERWVLTRKPSFARVLVEDSFRQHGVTTPIPVCETDGPVTAAKLVANGVGLSSVPASTAQEHVRSKAANLIRLQSPQQTAILGLVYRETSIDHPRIARLREALDLA